jgi:hypothetical protein
MTLSGLPSVFIAAYVVKEMPLEYVRWLVVVAVAYAAAMMLRSPLGPAATDREFIGRSRLD